MIKHIIVTGGAGVIGQNFINYMLSKQTKTVIVNLEMQTYAGNLENLCTKQENHNYILVEGNITDRALLNQLFEKYTFETVVNFAAETHVDRSIEDPEAFLTSNIIGTQALLDIARKYWAAEPENKYCRKYPNTVKFLQVSTDEVYGALGETGLFTEETPFLPIAPIQHPKPVLT